MGAPGADSRAPAGRAPGADLATFLARHGVECTLATLVALQDLPEEENRVTLDDDGSSPLPGVKIHYRTSENARRMMDFHLARLSEVLDVMGARKKTLTPAIRDSGWHLMGTTCMGTDRERSVVDRDGRTHDVANLFVYDASVFPTSSGVNPIQSRYVWALNTMLAWVFIAPFGTPVVPEV